MSKDARDLKHRAEGLRQPQRKDSLSSILSWAALQGKIAAPKTSTTTSATSQPSQTSPTSPTSRRHSHGSKTDTNTKARRGSTTLRSFSFSNSATVQDGTGTKTRHAKVSVTPEPKPSSPGASRTGKNSSSERVNKAPSDNSDAKDTARSRPGEDSREKPSPPAPPKPKPKSILRSPVLGSNNKRSDQPAVSPLGQTTDLDSPLSPLAPVGIAPDSPPGSPPMSPLNRPMSPGTTVRFAKATIHRVELGPGPRRFLPVKRKSKSTLTYIAPLDPLGPATQNNNKKNKNALLLSKTVLQNPIKLRRHQENQAAMGRYWLRTEEEEAQWRAEAERRAREEAERYRNEPASPPPKAAGADGVGMVKSALEVKGVVKASMAETGGDAKKVSSVGSGTVVVKVEEVVAKSHVPKPDEEVAVKCDQGLGETPSTTSKDPTETEQTDDRSGPKTVEIRGVEEPKKSSIQDQTPLEGLLEAETVASCEKAGGGPPSSILADTALEPVKGESPSSTPAAVTAIATAPHKSEGKEAVAAIAESTKAEAELPKAENTEVAESRVDSERPTDEQVAEQKTKKTASPSDQSDPPSTNTEPAKDKTPDTSSVSKVENQLTTEVSACQTSSGSTGSAACPSSGFSTMPTEQLTRVPSGEKDRESERDREKTKERERAKEKPRTAPVSKAATPVKPGGAAKADRATSRGYNSHSSTNSHSQGHGHGSNHLHLSGRRGRRYSDHKEGITA